jgi:hypothetical protein
MDEELRRMDLRTITHLADRQELTAEPFPADATARVQQRARLALKEGGFDDAPVRSDLPQEF